MAIPCDLVGQQGAEFSSLLAWRERKDKGVPVGAAVQKSSLLCATNWGCRTFFRLSRLRPRGVMSGVRTEYAPLAGIIPDRS
jgi:hypothetical protein